MKRGRPPGPQDNKNLLDTPYSKKNMDEFRRSNGLKIIIRGMRICMRCEKEFESHNVKTNRLCEDCGKRREDSF